MDALTACYASDSDEEDRGQEAAEPSRSEDGEPSLKRCRHSAVSVSVSEAEEVLATLQAQHEGRVRAFPHVDGDFATHVLVRVGVPPACRRPLRAILGKVAERLPDLHPLTSPAADMPTWGCNEFHLSLSRTVAIRAHQLEPLLQALRSSLRRWQRFATELGQMAVFVNDARTRTFLSLRTLPETDSQFKELVRRVDKAFMTQELAVFYEDPQPHASLAWVLGDNELQMSDAIADLFPQNSIGKGIVGEGSRWYADISNVECKIGNQYYSVVATK
ncbi:hypothetical protein CYMTET_52706 [Cymbomonas tetramitiformis]|uniref:U6 snRNA phosphodiesterase 1 n=1 Tax=Cymbomonas tetramitiformis TaxID=36881 RepID=A0AAE0EQT8_9CHLO|nr:hypothetical protein CYMTET_52706 [Cymbomonas tetramitiformis]